MPMLFLPLTVSVLLAFVTQEMPSAPDTISDKTGSDVIAPAKPENPSDPVATVPSATDTAPAASSSSDGRAPIFSMAIPLKTMGKPGERPSWIWDPGLRIYLPSEAPERLLTVVLRPKELPTERDERVYRVLVIRPDRIPETETEEEIFPVYYAEPYFGKEREDGSLYLRTEDERMSPPWVLNPAPGRYVGDTLHRYISRIPFNAEKTEPCSLRDNTLFFYRPLWKKDIPGEFAVTEKEPGSLKIEHLTFQDIPRP